MAFLLALAGALLPVSAANTLYVVMSANSEVQALEHKDVLALYTGRAFTLPGGQHVTALDQRHDGAARTAFYQALTGMDLARIDSYWTRLQFTGQVPPPEIVGDDEAVLRRVRSDPSAIGYVTREPNEPGVRVVLRLR